MHRILIFIIFISIAFAQTLSLGNGYVDVWVDNTTGDFEQGGDCTGTGNYVDLTYTYAYGGPPGTEWCMFYVDGQVRKNEGWILDDPGCLFALASDCSDCLPFLSSDHDATMPNASTAYIRWADSTIVVQWNNFNSVMIREELTPQSLGGAPGALEVIRCKIIMKPVSGCHSIGAAVYYDTQINMNDGVPISTAFGYVGYTEIFYAPTIPPVWKAYEAGYPPSPGDLTSVGITIGFEATMPDVLWYGPWRDAWCVWEISYELGWDTSPTAADFMWYWVANAGCDFLDCSGLGDSAVLVKWNQRTVCAPESVVFVTYYGIECEVTNTLYVECYPPELTTTCDGITPNPATFTFHIVNPSPSTAHNVCLSFNDNSYFTQIGGDADPMCFSSIAGYGGTQIIEWLVQLSSSAAGGNRCYTVTTSYDEGSPFNTTCCIDIPPLPSDCCDTIEAFWTCPDCAPVNFSSCSDQNMYLIMHSDTTIDTLHTWFTVDNGIGAPFTISEMTHPSNLSFTCLTPTCDSVQVQIHRFTWADGVNVTISLDSAYTIDACITEW